jgi:hypothetical protein
MKRSILAFALTLAIALIIFPVQGKTQMGPGMIGQGGYEEWNYCPYCGEPLWGPRMRGPGYGMGPGMMHRYWGRSPQYGPPHGPHYQHPREPLKEKDVKGILENYLRSTRNPNLKLGTIAEKDNYFEAEILTKDNSLVDKIIIDKYTGWMRSIY